MSSDSDSMPSDSERDLHSNFGGANMHARELSKRRANSKVLQTPTTPVTPVVPSTPIIAAHFYGGENVMEDLQLAAELGKTLLERNRELECNIKHQQAIIEDQAQEIEYLSKQTAALREVNDSRLRIYEQLEISIQDLEKGNQRLTAEGAVDKKRIKGFTATIELLENRVLELQKCLDDAKALQQKAQQQPRGRTHKRRSSLVSEEQLGRRSQSCENTTQTSETSSAEENELRERVQMLENLLKEAEKHRISEATKRDEIEIDLSCLAQENNVLKQKLAVLQEKGENLRSFDEELASLDETSSSRVCRKCLGMVDEVESNNTMQDYTDDIEDLEASFESIHGECALVKLKNGGYAYGSQESLASFGQVLNGVAHCGDSPSTDASDVPRNSLLSELDAQYRVLIEKYESLIETRERQQQETLQRYQSSKVPTIVDSGVDEVSGPMSIVLTNGAPHPHGAMLASAKCQRCTTCTCDLKPTDSQPKSNSEEFSEVETTSSGFSEGESRFVSRGIQTDKPCDCFANASSLIARKGYIETPTDPLQNRFQKVPEYRKIFSEMLTVLKNSSDKPELTGVQEKIMDSLKNSKNDEDFFESLSWMGSSKGSEAEVKEDENDENINPNAEPEAKIVLQKKKKRGSSKNPTKTTEEKPQMEPEEPKETKETKPLEKPKRPDTLEIGDLSRSSSRQSRRRRRQKENKRNSAAKELLKEQKAEPAVQPLPLTTITTNDAKKETESAPKPPPEPIPETMSQEKPCIDEQKPSKPSHCEHKPKRQRNKRNKQNLLQEVQKEQFRKNSSIGQYYDPQLYNKDSYQNSIPKISFPSVAVASLRQAEISYAQAVRSSYARSQQRY